MSDLCLVALVVAAVIVVAVLLRLRQCRSRQDSKPRHSYNCLTIRMIADERAADRHPVTE